MQQYDLPCNTVADGSVNRNRQFLLLCLIAAASLLQAAHAQSTNPGTSNLPALANDVQLFQVASDKSILRIMVGRNGLLSRIGHNHVVVSRSITGTIRFDNWSGQADAHLVIPVDELLVDEAGERLRAGTGYESVPGETAKLDTRTNMLRPEVLDVQRYPEILIDTALSGYDASRNTIAVSLTFKGIQIPLHLPATLTITANSLQVDTNFSLNHKDLGLRPFSVLGGALRVAETLDFELHIEAVSSR